MKQFDTPYRRIVRNIAQLELSKQINVKSNTMTISRLSHLHASKTAIQHKSYKSLRLIAIHTHEVLDI